MVLGDPLGRYALGQFNPRRSGVQLAVSEDDDVASFKGYVWPAEMCKPRTICQTGAPYRDASCIVLQLTNPTSFVTDDDDNRRYG